MNWFLYSIYLNMVEIHWIAFVSVCHVTATALPQQAFLHFGSKGVTVSTNSVPTIILILIKNSQAFTSCLSSSSAPSLSLLSTANLSPCEPPSHDLSPSLRFYVIIILLCDGCMQIASKSPLSCRSKLPSVTEHPGLMFVVLAELKLRHCVEEVSDSNHPHPQWLLCISSCMCFVGVSWTAVDLQIDFNSWNDNHGLIGYGCVVVSGAVNKRSRAAGVYDGFVKLEIIIALH